MASEMVLKAVSTLAYSLELISMKVMPFSSAMAYPSSWVTVLSSSRSFLFPTSKISMWGLPLFLTSSSQFLTWLKVSLLGMDGYLPGNIVNEECSDGTSVVRSGDRPKVFLTGSVPDL